MKKSDDGSAVILASGKCPFCLEPVHVVCGPEEVKDVTKVKDGRVVAVLCRTYAHPAGCKSFEEMTSKLRGPKGWKKLWRVANIQIDETPLGESLN